MSRPILIHEQTAISMKLYVKPPIASEEDFSNMFWEHENFDYHCDYKESAKDFFNFFYNHSCIAFLEELKILIDNELNKFYHQSEVLKCKAT